MAEQKEYRPPTQSQIGSIVSMPNQRACSRLAVTAIKCLENLFSSPIQALAFLALNKVS